jgi:hypothetical protein
VDGIAYSNAPTQLPYVWGTARHNNAADRLRLTKDCNQVPAHGAEARCDKRGNAVKVKQTLTSYNNIGQRLRLRVDGLESTTGTACRAEYSTQPDRPKSLPNSSCLYHLPALLLSAHSLAFGTQAALYSVAADSNGSMVPITLSAMLSARSGSLKNENLAQNNLSPHDDVAHETALA